MLSHAHFMGKGLHLTSETQLSGREALPPILRTAAVRVNVSHHSITSIPRIVFLNMSDNSTSRIEVCSIETCERVALWSTLNELEERMSQ